MGRRVASTTPGHEGVSEVVVVEVSANYEGQAAIMSQAVVGQQAEELQSALETRQSQVYVHEQHAALMPASTLLTAHDQRPAAFLERKGQVHVFHVCQRKAAQYGIAIASPCSSRLNYSNL